MNFPSFKLPPKKTLVPHGEKSVVKQLNNVPILHGYLRVSLRLNKDKTDWLFLAWVEGRGDLPDLYSSDSALVNAWRKSGRDEAELAKLLRNPLPELADEERCLCEAAKIELPKVQRFIQLCKVAIGKNKLHRLLAEIKVDVVEGRGIHNPTGTFVWRLLKLISEPARPLN